jgi:hypothetical protein
MRFTDKSLSFSIDGILKSSNYSTHFSLPKLMHKNLYSNSYHCHLSLLQSDLTYRHHRRCRRTRTVFSGK